MGSVIGGRIFERRDVHGHDVALVARGAHHDAVSKRGLTIHSPQGTSRLQVPVVDRVARLELTSDDIVILSTKTQDSLAALEDLARHAPPDLTVVCAQNGVENERLALRIFERVQAVCVMLPASLTEPGVIDAYGAPHNAILDIGRYPSGVDETTERLSSVFRASGLASVAEPSIMRWKYRKLLMNLGNVIDALVEDGGAVRTHAESGERIRSFVERARDEARACFDAAGIDVAGEDEDRVRRAGVMASAEIPGRERRGSSTWQSLARGAASSEVDWLNGEIVLLGRTHGVSTPVNAMLQAVMREAVRAGARPRSLPLSALEARLTS